MRRTTLAAAALLVFLAVPAIFAAPVQAEHPDCVVLVANTVGVACNGTYWCDNGGLCAQEICTLQVGSKQYVCVLSPP